MQFELRRREFITLLGGAAAWPLAAQAQEGSAMRRVGVLIPTEEHDPESQARIAAFRLGLEEFGWTNGRNIRIDYRFAGGDTDRIRTHVAELVNSAPDLVVGNSSPVIVALKRATRTIPIVFAMVNDPVGQGFVASLARPGGNITGFSLVDVAMVGKWLELLKLMVPGTRRTTLLFNPITAPYYADFVRALAANSTTVATELTSAPVRDRAEIEVAVATAARESGSGLMTGADPFTVANRALIISLAQRYRLPAIFQFRPFPDVLWTRHVRYFPAVCLIRRPHSQGCQARRPAGPAAHEIRAGHQS